MKLAIETSAGDSDYERERLRKVIRAIDKRIELCNERYAELQILEAEIKGS